MDLIISNKPEKTIYKAPIVYALAISIETTIANSSSTASIGNANLTYQPDVIDWTDQAPPNTTYNDL
ncbi:hypothetical protein [Sphingobacterium bovistauri]|uniref:Uncharacterized protein n=1 Tax=Sphingobacterium bovistauri TaxID=2781959 RepID=A0ABS7Z329_9SPHI|nr:hypothetical protein [Sphingobacterium bovistauri]MCA5004561.1 hypothetical protein [Sphingobacterium bovistauri]